MSTHTMGSHSRLRGIATSLCALALSVPMLLAEPPTVQITSPKSGALFHPGQTIEITVEATPSAFRTVVVTGFELGFSQILSAPPFRFQIEIPKKIETGAYSLQAIGAHDTAVDSEPVTVKIERPDSPVKLESDPRWVPFHYTDDEVALIVEGTFRDGSKVKLTRSTLTTYSCDTPSVATVDAQGVVDAVGPGSARITIKNGKATLVIPVHVGDKKRPQGQSRDRGYRPPPPILRNAHHEPSIR